MACAVQAATEDQPEQVRSQSILDCMVQYMHITQSSWPLLIPTRHIACDRILDIEHVAADSPKASATQVMMNIHTLKLFMLLLLTACGGRATILLYEM